MHHTELYQTLHNFTALHRTLCTLLTVISVDSTVLACSKLYSLVRRNILGHTEPLQVDAMSAMDVYINNIILSAYTPSIL